MFADDNLWQQLKFSCHRIKFERSENRDDVRVISWNVSYYINVGQIEEEYLKRLQSTYGNEAQFFPIVFRVFTEFRTVQNSLLEN